MKKAARDKEEKVEFATFVSDMYKCRVQQYWLCLADENFLFV
jgi:hypothetical protein